MSISQWWSRHRNQQAPETLQTREMDSFADNVLFELKTITTQAITHALEQREPHYLRAILEESYFVLDSLVIKALDTQTSKDLETFLSNHEAIDAQFRKKFFAQVLQREFRSKRGASVKVDPNLEPIIELAPEALEKNTADETFIISLKGRQIRFAVQAVLQGPISKSRQDRAPTFSVEPELSGLSKAAQASTTQTSAKNSLRVHVTLFDRRGKTEQLVGLPLILGREARQYADQAALSGLDIDATYVSRQQLLVFELLGEVHCFVPSSASLTCSLADGRAMQRNSLYRVSPGLPLQLLGGLPADGLGSPPARTVHGDYPMIELRSFSQDEPVHEATPRPRAVK